MKQMRKGEHYKEKTDAMDTNIECKVQKKNKNLIT